MFCIDIRTVFRTIHIGGGKGLIYFHIMYFFLKCNLACSVINYSDDASNEQKNSSTLWSQKRMGAKNTRCKFRWIFIISLLTFKDLTFHDFLSNACLFNTSHRRNSLIVFWFSIMFLFWNDRILEMEGLFQRFPSHSFP